MNRTLRALVPAAVLACAAVPLLADVTMRITGHVTDKDGKPVSAAKVAILKTDTGWRREVQTDSNGVYSQAGLAPDKGNNYEITISKDGFSNHVKRIGVPLLGSSYSQDFTIYRPGETPLPADAADFAATPNTTSPALDPALKEDADARAAFNTAIPLYNAKQYAEALPNLEKAYKGMSDAVATMKDESAKADSQAQLPSMSKAYGLALHQTGKDDEAIAPLSQLVDADPKNAKNADAMLALVEIYTKKKDDANRAKYQGVLNAATGTSNASVPYNEGVKAFNANRFKEAKQHLQKAVEADASFPDSYYLLGLIEMNQGNMAGAKAHFRKYIELAPNGSHAEEVKGALSAL